MKLTSRFNLVNTIIVPGLFLIGLAVLACLIIFLSLEEVETGKVDSIFKTPVYGSFILFGIIIGLIIHYIKICKTISIDEKGINLSNYFKSEFIPWENILEIELLGKSERNTVPTDATNLNLKNERRLSILASHYKNMDEIRQILQQVIDCKEANITIEFRSIKKNPNCAPIGFIDLSKMKKYSSNHFLSFNGVFFYGLNAFTIIMAMTHLGVLLFLSLLIFAMTFGFFGYQLHYFYLDKNHLVIKNHLWPWVNDKYKVENIQQIIFDPPYKRSTSMRVITKDLKSKLYSGGSLRKSIWKSLEKDIDQMNMNVKNEAF